MGLKELNQPKTISKQDSEAAAAAKALRLRAELTELIEQIPQSLDSLLHQLFPEATYVDNQKSAKGFRYRWLIDDRPVNKKEHQKVCRALVTRLQQILAWFEEHGLQSQPLIVEANSKVVQRFGKDNCESKFSPLFPLAILDDLASGKSVAELLPDVMDGNVKTVLTGVTSLIRPAMVALGIEASDVVSAAKSKGDDKKSANDNANVNGGTEVNWSGFFPPGLWYKPFGLSEQQWRKALRDEWIPAGLAQRDPLTPERGKVRFAKSLLDERGVTEPV